jgi:ABC-type multidrug transport system fused ATPase/permease subunit
VFFSVTGGMLSINKILPFAAAVMSATQSAAALTVIIDEAPAENGIELAKKTEITGKVQFKDVSFSYPLDSKHQVQCNKSVLYLNYINTRFESPGHKKKNLRGFGPLANYADQLHYLKYIKLP